ncbi:MAG: succinate dehydrogenase [Burkholderiales bacterium]|nr:succinate dehydrogenase [Burkholderiales bacterium]
MTPARRAEMQRFVAQRATAMVLACCVAVHLATLIFAVRHGLSAAAILGRTRSSLPWTLFYGTFVIAAAIHAPLGLRNILTEWSGWRGRGLDLACLLYGAALAALGLRAVYAVCWGGV